MPEGPVGGSDAVHTGLLRRLVSGVGIVSINAQVQSERAISRAVWEYNRALPTDASGTDAPE